MTRISACIIAYNEENNIRRCLESIKGIADEIILIHDGECQDKTLAIAEEFGAKIFVRTHKGAMEYHLPFALRAAKGEWILRIDADEFLSDELKGKIKALAVDTEFNGFEFLWPLWDGKKYITKTWPHKLCLFRRNCVSFLAIPHFSPEIEGKIKIHDLLLEHQPSYNNFTWFTFKTKWLKWARLQANAYLTNFKDIEKFNYNAKDWLLIYKLRVKFPLLFFLIDFPVSFCRQLVQAAGKGEFFLKYFLMTSLYKSSIDFYLMKQKQTHVKKD